MEKVRYNTKKNNEFSSWYYQRIKRDVEKKIRLVEENPILALRTFNIFRDKELGAIFIDKYKDHPQLSHVAYHIAKDLKDKFEREYLEKQRHEIDGPLYMCIREYDPLSSIHSCGNDISNSNHWADNEWDNIVRALEESV